MSGRRILVAAAFAFAVSRDLRGDGCCTHLGQPVTCPAGLPPGSSSVRFVPEGTEWVTPAGQTVFVPATTFTVCRPTTPTPTATPTRPSPTATPSLTPMQTPRSTPVTPSPAPTQSSPTPATPLPTPPAPSATRPIAVQPPGPVVAPGPDVTETPVTPRQGPVPPPIPDSGPAVVMPPPPADDPDRAIRAVGDLLRTQEKSPVPTPPPTGRPFNGPVVQTLGQENPTKPACACSGQGSYNQGISIVVNDCPKGANKCETVGSYPRIAQAAGPFSVTLNNGEFVHREVDLEIPGIGFSWRLERRYRSGILFDGPLGHNWEFGDNRRLHVASDGVVTRMDGSGHADRFVPGPSGFIPPAGSYTRLARLSGGGFVERDRTGARATYGPPGTDGMARLVEAADRHRNALRYEYDAAGRLARLTDTAGRKIAFRYDPAGRLAEVEDFVGRRVRYAYDAKGDLVAATLPAIVGTPNGNDFPDGTTTRYRYSSGSFDERFNHLLTEITAPNEAASGGPPRVKVEYDMRPASPDARRVLRQTVGGTNASGVAAGGTISYEYRRLAAAVAGDTAMAVFENRVTDRNGNRSDWVFNQNGNILAVREYANRKVSAGDPDFFETRYEYNRDGEMTRMVLPLGSRVEYVYDDGNPDRLQRGNLLSETEWPDPVRGADQKFLRTAYTYEPIFNQVRTVTDPRAFDGNGTSGRFTRTMFFDYQEGAGEAALAAATGLTEAEVRALLARANVPLRLGDLNKDGRTTQAAGDVVKVVRPGNLVETTVRDSHGRVTSTTDAEGVVTRTVYAPDGAPAAGAPVETIRNPGGRPGTPTARTKLSWDAVGNLVAVVNPRGVESRRTYNSRNQVVETARASAVDGLLANPAEPPWSRCKADLLECHAAVPFRERTRLFYDANGNLVREETGEGADRAVRTMRYDVLDALVETASPSGASGVASVLRVRYDRNGNRVHVASPAASLPAGNPERQDGNVVTYAYDERDRLVATTRGGDTIRNRRDANGDLVETIDGEGRPVQTLLRDGFGRVRSSVDAVGTQVLVARNADDEISAVWEFGSTGGRAARTSAALAPPLSPESMKQPLLAASRFAYDDAGRVVEKAERLFDVRPAAPPAPENWLRTKYEFDRRGALVSTATPGGSITKATYDALGRLERIVDPEGNESHRTYDANDNLTSEEILGPAPGKGSAPARERRRTARVYDALDRLVRITDDSGLATRFEYDGAGRLVRRTGPAASGGGSDSVDDPLGLVRPGVAPPRVSRPGTAAAFEYDAAGRVVRETRGAPDGPALATIDSTWDVNGRLSSRTDGAGRRSRFTYDERDRLVEETDASGRTLRYAFDANDRVVRVTLADGNTVRLARDARGLVVSRELETAGKAPRRPGTTRQEFEWDGAGRLTRAFDDNEPGDPGDDAETRIIYDSLGRIVEETQNGRHVATRWDEDGRPVGLAYPGGPDLKIDFDRIGRLREIRDGASSNYLARYRYTVATGPLERENGNGTRARWFDPAKPGASGPDGSGRTRVLLHSDASGTTFAGASYEWSGRSRTAAVASDGARKDWTYDALARLTSERAAGRSAQWSFDGAGNWLDSGGGKNEVDARDAYTMFEGARVLSDGAGNTTDDGQRLYEYDFSNRLRRVRRKGDGRLIATYSYDALDRRVGRLVEGTAGGRAPEHFAYVYDRWNEIQEIRESETRSFVYGAETDEVVRTSRRSADGKDLGSIWLHQDANLNVVAVTDGNGKPVQRVAYDAYGKAAVSGADTGNAFLFQGRRLDPETGLYYFRMRYYSPAFGRFLTRDPLGAWADPRALGNPYVFVGNSPLSGRDPLGLQGHTVEKKTSDCEWRLAKNTNYVPGATEQGTSTVTSRKHTGAKKQVYIATITEGYVTVKEEISASIKGDLIPKLVEFQIKWAVESGVKVAVQKGERIYYDLLYVETVTHYHEPWYHVYVEYCKKITSTPSGDCPRDGSGLAPMNPNPAVVTWSPSGKPAKVEVFWKELDITTYAWEVKLEKVPDQPGPQSPAGLLDSTEEGSVRPEGVPAPSPGKKP